MKLQDITMEWKGFGNGFGKWHSKCRLRVYNHDEITVCVFTELPENAGTSITNAAEAIAMMALKQFDIAPNKYVHVEHYPQDKKLKMEENFSSVGFDVMLQKNRLDPTGRTQTAFLTKPIWTPLKKAHVESLIGEALDA